MITDRKRNVEQPTQHFMCNRTVSLKAGVLYPKQIRVHSPALTH